MNNLKKWDAVTVVWEDAVTRHGASNSKRYVKEYRPIIRKSIGYLIEKNSRHVHISATDDRPSKEYDDVDEVTTIPMGMVIEVILLVPQETPEPEPQSKQQELKPLPLPSSP